MRTNVDTIPGFVAPDLDAGQLGPAMQALTDKQRRFVVNMLELGGGPGKYLDCAVRAGYSGEKNSLAQTVHRLVHDEKIQNALQEEAKRRLKAGAVMAVSGLLQLAEEEGISPKDRLRAYEMILNRTGLPSQTEQKVTVEHRMSDHELVNRVQQLAKTLGIDPAKLLPAPVEEAEYVDITPETGVGNSEPQEEDWTAL